MDLDWCIRCDKHTKGGLYCSDTCQREDYAEQAIHRHQRTADPLAIPRRATAHCPTTTPLLVAGYQRIRPTTSSGGSEVGCDRVGSNVRFTAGLATPASSPEQLAPLTTTTTTTKKQQRKEQSHGVEASSTATLLLERSHQPQPHELLAVMSSGRPMSGQANLLPAVTTRAALPLWKPSAQHPGSKATTVEAYGGRVARLPQPAVQKQQPRQACTTDRRQRAATTAALSSRVSSLGLLLAEYLPSL